MAPDLFQRIHHRQAVNHRCQHTHVITGSAVDIQFLLPRSTKEIAAADDDGDVHAEAADLVHFARNALNCFGVNP